MSTQGETRIEAGQHAATRNRGDAAHRTAQTLLERIENAIPWSRQTTLFALAVSLFVHLALLLWAALVVWGESPASAATGEGEVPLAVVAESNLQTGILSGLAAEVPTLENLREPDLGPPAEGPPTDADSQTLEMTDTGEVTGAGDVESIGGGSVFGESGAQFFGVEARGSRFAYVLDVSGSMQGNRITELRGALAASINGLFEHARFVVVPYSNTATPLAEGEWADATDRLKRKMLGWFNSIEPAGGTDPRTAFRVVFDLRPRPDAIYFMTDGVFESVEDDLLAMLRRENQGGGTTIPIHCFTMIERGAETTMRTIATESGGTYTHLGGSP